MSAIPRVFPQNTLPHTQTQFADLSAIMLGASLYMPASRPDLVTIASGDKFPWIRSLIFCTEDAVHEQDLELALANLAALLPTLKTGLPCFIRPRSPIVLARLLKIEGIEHIQGFVLPKVGLRTLGDWLQVWDDCHNHYMMPILETIETFDRRKMELLRDRLENSGLRERIPCLRIGGNDLLNLLGIRRARGATIYDTPLRSVIADLACVFYPAGYQLSAPVFEYLDTPDVLKREVEADLQHGLVGKTAIHPSQIKMIEDCYRVSREDYDMAAAVLAPDAAVVFKQRETFCEPATHRYWAEGIMERVQLFGVVDRLAGD